MRKLFMKLKDKLIFICKRIPSFQTINQGSEGGVRNEKNYKRFYSSFSHATRAHKEEKQIPNRRIRNKSSYSLINIIIIICIPFPLHPFARIDPPTFSSSLGISLQLYPFWTRWAIYICLQFSSLSASSSTSLP